MSTIETDMKSTMEEEGRRHAEQHDYGHREAATLERDIDATRADVRATLAALERRLSFERLVELTLGRIRERGGEFAGNLTDTATKNPVPVLLTSIGLGWMMLTSRRGQDDSQPGRTRARAAGAANRVSGAAERVGERLHDAGARVHEAVESSRETLGATADSLRDGASRAAAATRERVDHASERIDRLLHEQPLLLGALGLAAGAVIGALLPATEAEGRLLGEVREKAVDDVARTSRTLYETARENAAAFSAPAGRDEDARGERPPRPH